MVIKREIENSRRLLVSAEQITTNADDVNPTSPEKKVNIEFQLSLTLDDPHWHDISIFGIHRVRFSLASLANSPGFLDRALARLFVGFPDPGTFWCDGEAPFYPIAGLAGASEKIMPLVTGAPLKILVKIQKLITLAWPEDSWEWDGDRRDAYRLAQRRAEFNRYFDGETEENNRVFITAREITRNGRDGRMYLAIDLSHTLEEPLGEFETLVETRHSSFPLAAFASRCRARTVIEPVLAGLGIRFPVTGTAWRCKDESAVQPIAGLAGAAERIAELGVLMRFHRRSASPSLEMRVKIEKRTVMMRPEDSRRFVSKDWKAHYGAAIRAEIARYFDGETVPTTRYGGEDKLSCPICMDDVETGVHRHVVQLVCSHWFHGDCIEQWMEKSKSCPNCRSVIHDFAVEKPVNVINGQIMHV